MKGGAGKQYSIAVCTLDVRTDGDLIQVLPAGRFRARDGRPHDVPAGWLLDDEIAHHAVESARARTVHIPIDYEHQTLHAEKNGQPAPAAGWVDPSTLEWRPGDGLYARVKWTEAAKAHLAADEYRYLSAVFPYDKQGRVKDLLMLTLTNFPALDQQPDVQSLAAAKFDIDNDPQQEDAPMNEQLLQLLGLAKDATDEQINQAVAALKRRLIAVATLKALGLDESAEPGKADEAITALTTQVAEKDDQIAALKANSGNPDPTKYVPLETVTELKTELADVKKKLANDEIDELVTAALKDGRLYKAEESWARQLGEKDIALLKQHLDNQQPIAALKHTQTGGKPPEDTGADRKLTDDELAVCKATGISEEAYKKANNIGTAAASA